MSHCKCIHKIALGFGIGITSALFILVMGAAALLFGWGATTYTNIANLYGSTLSWKGILMGTLWCFIQGFIFGFLVALFYNLFVECCRYCGLCNRPGEVCTKHPEEGPKV